MNNDDVTKSNTGSDDRNSFSAAANLERPKLIDRYRIRGILGEGGFGTVFRATDELLHRDVALKVPSPKVVDSGNLANLVAEAQVVASLDHPYIVPVYNVGSTPEYAFYLVSKLVEGSDLQKRLQAGTVSVNLAVGWIACMADALNYAHSKGLVHRDVKPSNMLIDAQDHPWLADFGLALRDGDLGKGPRVSYAGTYSYMSPEQARGEGHLLDGRADIFSLGIVLYELLAGVRPFTGQTREQLLNNIVALEHRPLRQRNSKLHRELERICNKALAKRASERYSTAADMSEELFQYLRSQENRDSPTLSQTSAFTVTDSTSASLPQLKPKVVPKGLRAFDENDRDFFLRLFPGPYDTHGIPELMRVWVSRIETIDVAKAFRVGLIYGPSGSGKSSFMRAGLIPLLNDSINVVFVEASASQTEARLLAALPSVSQLNDAHDLALRLAALRQSGANRQEKILIVIDQFEQWLNANSQMENSTLVNALRQCDGVHVQCLLLIRDDFWMAATRFFRELDIRLLEGINSSPIDRFELRHARQVLAEFGRAYDCLPDDLSLMSDEQSQFLDTVIASIEEEGKVISVHLSLMAQMLKGREWVPRTLSEIGGAEGLGLNFLNATFSARTAPPAYRALEIPARKVLSALLPDEGTDIKGQMQPGEQLRNASELTRRDFESLIDILDGELRLITPVDRVDVTDSGSFFQLTHDFLVRPLREWLTMKERETPTGRAKLRMQELAQLWRHKPEKRYLPDLVEFLRMSWLTKGISRSEAESKMMRAASRHHGSRVGLTGLAGLAIVLSMGFVANRIATYDKEQQADAIVNQLLVARTDEVPAVLRELDPLKSQVVPRLHELLLDPLTLPSELFRARLALVTEDASQVEPLLAATGSLSVPELDLVIEGLQIHQAAAQKQLWSMVSSTNLPEDAWLRVVYTLTAFDDSSSKWQTYAERLCDSILNQNPTLVSQMAKVLARQSAAIATPLLKRFQSTNSDFETRLNSATLLAQCCDNRPELLSEMIVTAKPEQFAALLPVMQAGSTSLLPLLNVELSQQHEAIWPVSSSKVQQLGLSTRQEIEAADGFVTDTFAVAQNMALKNFEALKEAMTGSGYHPVSLRYFHLANEQARIAVVWHRNGYRWQFTKYTTAAAARAQLAPMKQMGLFPIDFTLLRSPVIDSNEELFGILWSEIDKSAFIDMTMYLGVPELEHESAWSPMNELSYKPKSNMKYRDASGTAYYSSIRAKLRISPTYEDSWDDEASVYDSRIVKGWYQTDVRQNPPGWVSGNVTYAAAWWSGGNVESRTLDHLSLAEHAGRFRQLETDGYRPVSISVIESEGDMVATSVWHRLVVSEEELDRIASRQANAAIALYHLQHRDRLLPLLSHSSDPRLRSFLIDRAAAMLIKPQELFDQLVNESNVHRQIAIIEALAHYRREQVPDELANRIIGLIEGLGCTHPAAGMHSICLHFCRRWGLSESEQKLIGARPPIPTASSDSIAWEPILEGHTLAKIAGPVEFDFGSPGNELYRDHSKEVTRRCRIPRSFAIAINEVTVAQYQRFDSRFSFAGDYTPNDRCPIGTLSWLQAAKYCRWLSEQALVDDDEMCYPKVEEISLGMTLPANFLERTGFRLPTEAEWEYACRAGAATSRFYGNSDELISRYAWTAANSQYMLQPVGQLAPNLFGLFDTLGNVWELTDSAGEPSIGRTKGVFVDSGGFGGVISNYRVTRGGAFLYAPFVARCASQERGLITERYVYNGFRIARTLSQPKQ